MLLTAAALLVVVQTNFNDGKEHEIILFNQAFFVSPGQCFIDYVNASNQFYVWIAFPNGKKIEAIKEGRKHALKMCDYQCEPFAIICNL